MRSIYWISAVFTVIFGTGTLQAQVAAPAPAPIPVSGSAAAAQPVAVQSGSTGECSCMDKVFGRMRLQPMPCCRLTNPPLYPPHLHFLAAHDSTEKHVLASKGGVLFPLHGEWHPLDHHYDQRACDPFLNKKTCQNCSDKSYLNVDRPVIDCGKCKELASQPRAYKMLTGTYHCEIILKDPDYKGSLKELPLFQRAAEVESNEKASDIDTKAKPEK